MKFDAYVVLAKIGAEGGGGAIRAIQPAPNSTNSMNSTGPQPEIDGGATRPFQLPPCRRYRNAYTRKQKTGPIISQLRHVSQRP